MGRYFFTALLLCHFMARFILTTSRVQIHKQEGQQEAAIQLVKQQDFQISEARNSPQALLWEKGKVGSSFPWGMGDTSALWVQRNLQVDLAKLIKGRDSTWK